MSALVEDMLLLARLDAGRPLERDEVDLTRLLLEAVGDARVVGAGPPLAARPARRAGRASPATSSGCTRWSPTCSATPARHTPARHDGHGRASRQDGDEVVLTVQDDGPGCPAGLRGPRVRAVHPRRLRPHPGVRRGAASACRWWRRSPQRARRHGLGRARARDAPAFDGPAARTGRLPQPSQAGDRAHHTVGPVRADHESAVMDNQTTTLTPPKSDRPSDAARRAPPLPAAPPRAPIQVARAGSGAATPRTRPGRARRCSGCSPPPPCCTCGASARQGWANSFYSAAVQAGSESWKAFFFGSSDAAGSITVDKTAARRCGRWRCRCGSSASRRGASWSRRR